MQIEAEDHLWIARAEDAAAMSDKRYTPVSIGFLTPHQKNVIQTNVRPPADVRFLFFGGYDAAERTLLISYPDFIQPEPSDYITALEVTGRMVQQLSHRDYLGSLLGLGLKREKIGDILPFDQKAIVFVWPEIAGYIIENLTKVGNCGVQAERIALTDVAIPKRAAVLLEGTVSSLRLDCVLAFALGMSRSKASALIQAERVTCNFEKAVSVSLLLQEGDLLSVRGFGRYRLARIGGRTRKDKLHITVERFL